MPDANALDLADRIHQKMEQLAKSFPEDLHYAIQYDTTPYTRECIEEVVKALRDAVILVAFVVLLFLQNWRSALIPLIAVPVAIVGTFGVMAAMHFSLNNLTLFGLVLAIGIVVDDAIVVVEAVEHHIEQGLAPRDATIKAMSQVSGPVIAVGLVLSAVFVPCAFITGLTGQFFRQFALTIAASTIISTLNSLTLSPALLAVLLKERDKETHEPLPRLFFPFAAGWAGYVWLTPVLTLWLGRLALVLPKPAAEHALIALNWIAPAAAVAVPALAGWWVGRPAIAVLRWAFRGFNAGFQARHAGLCRRRRRLDPRRPRGAGRLCRPARSDLLGIHDHPQGLRPAAGHGLFDRQLADAGRRLGGADAGDHRPRATHLPRHSRGEAHPGGRGDVVRLPGQRLELRLDVRHPRRFPQARGAGTLWRRRSPPRCGSGSPPRFPAPGERV